MRSLLTNVHGRLVNGPILVICYTNHALDQFLSGIAAFSDAGVVRIGSRSKAEDLARFNLKAVILAEREANKKAGVGGEKARLRRSLIARQAELQVRVYPWGGASLKARARGSGPRCELWVWVCSQAFTAHD